MSNISAKLVKELRKRTGSGMMECKKALVIAAGNIEKAAEYMRISGQAQADKKSIRIAAEGVIETYSAYGRGVLLEINSETDFVARDKIFRDFTKETVKAVHGINATTIPQALEARISTGETVEEARKALVSKMGENIQIRRVKIIEGDNLGSYIHSGRIGVIVALESGDEKLAKDIAMHIAATNPQYINSQDIPRDVVEKERMIQVEIAMKSGKPKEIAEKMVEGRIKKFTDEVSLTGQSFVKDLSIKVGDFLKDNGAKVTTFIRLDVGSDIKKKEENFATEVMNQIKG